MWMCESSYLTPWWCSWRRRWRWRRWWPVRARRPWTWRRGGSWWGGLLGQTGLCHEPGHLLYSQVSEGAVINDHLTTSEHLVHPLIHPIITNVTLKMLFLVEEATKRLVTRFVNCPPNYSHSVTIKYFASPDIIWPRKCAVSICFVWGGLGGGKKRK